MTGPSPEGRLNLSSQYAAGGGDRAGSRAAGGIVRALLRIPLLYKILIANAVIVALVILAGVMVGRVWTPGTAFFVALVIGAVILSVVSNAFIVRLALSPLAALERTAERVQAGDLSARAEPSHLADAQLERVMHTFNAMLDSGEAYRQRLRDIAARALNATEEERKRIARELHDGIAQTLAALRLRLRMARSVADESVRNGLLERIGADIGEATEEIRNIAQGLRPPALDMLGLAPAIESLARSIAETTGTVVDTDIGNIERQLPAEAELALYRIVQEALSNVARHSAAQRAWVRMQLVGRHVDVTIEDDGKGFDVAAVMDTGLGLGLFGMQERGGYVGGSVEIDSKPGAGTRIRVTIPVVETARYA